MTFFHHRSKIFVDVWGHLLLRCISVYKIEKLVSTTIVSIGTIDAPMDFYIDNRLVVSAYRNDDVPNST